MTADLRGAGAQEHEMSEDDWKALYLVQELARQVCLTGRRALLPFAQAVIEMEQQ